MCDQIPLFRSPDGKLLCGRHEQQRVMRQATIFGDDSELDDEDDVDDVEEADEPSPTHAPSDDVDEPAYSPTPPYYPTSPAYSPTSPTHVYRPTAYQPTQ